MRLPTRVFGVDFSGGANAGDKLWVAQGEREGDRLILRSCLPARELPGGSRARDGALAALRALVEREREAAFGLDFPFAVAAPLMGQESWLDWLAHFAARYPAPEAFREACRAAAAGRELKRATDAASRVPFNAYNLRVYRQTYYGVRDVLAPLVDTGAACVLPMQPPCERAWLLELCPASTLKKAGLYYTPEGRPWTYKGRTAAAREARVRLLDFLETRAGVVIADPGVRDRLLADSEGDALDAVITAWATAQVVAGALELAPRYRELAWQEGYIYF